MTVPSTSGSSSGLSSANEDITTIFVVGFPEDMQEREFQNMFVFSTGFEAATLKIPASSPEDSGDGSGIAGSNVNSRKQIIGFAKFRTRSEAMKARDVLNGRKVDADKGSVLKAEMAKKNLHTKRGLSSDQGAAATMNGHTSPTSADGRNEGQNVGGFDALSTVPVVSSLLSSQDYAYDYLYGNGKNHPLAENGNANMPSIMSVQQPNSADSTVMDGLLLRKAAQDNRSVGSTCSQISRLNAVKSLLDLPDIVTTRSELHQPAGRTMNDMYTSPNSAPMNNVRPFGHTYNQSLPSASEDLMAAFTSATPSPSLTCFSPLPVNVGKVSSSALGTSPLALNAIITTRPSNMGDQNPPCNTLYVGNLAANTNEEELRLLFSRCLGYKRMCFKAKSNGPMCFVEFDDVTLAANALQNLQGTLLSNSVKGGIRLSYSKNPLGVRQQKISPAPLVMPGNSVYIPSGPASAPPSTNMSPFGTFSPINRDILGGNGNRSNLRENWSNISNSPLRDSGLLAPSVGTIGQIPSHTSTSPSLLRLGIIASPNTPGSTPSTDLMFPSDVVSLAYAEMENARREKEAELRRSDYHLESVESALVGSA